ncbi:radical SAM protein [Thermodesulfobacteriota bacterium]
MPFIFGPVPSRRLGLSLGVDMIPLKTCTYDCLYCQVGKTSCQIIEPKPFAPIHEVIGELEKTLEKASPDSITLAGSGEPTIHSELDQLISLIKEMTDIRIALLTNGSLFWKEEIRERVLNVDILMPTLCTVFENTFRAIHRPHQGLNLPVIIKGLKELRLDYRGLIFLEVVLLSGFNDSERELEGLKRVIDEISPEKIQLNTVVRPPSDSRAISIDIERLEDIKMFFGEKAEIIAHAPLKKRGGKHDSRIAAIVEMSRRRPVTAVDIAGVLNINLKETVSLLKGLLLKGVIREQEHGGEVFYVVD